MITHIARLGKIIGQYSLEDLEKALAGGSISGADHWWRPGMKDWLLISSESPLPPKVKGPTDKPARGEKDWRVRPTHRPTRFDEPATEKQLALIKQAGLTDILGLTRQDASRWLDLILGTSDGRRSLNERQYQAKQEQDALNEKAGLGCDGHRTPSGQFRKEINFCLKCIEDRRAEILKEMESVKKDMEDDPDNKEDYMAMLKESQKAYRDEEKDYLPDIAQQMVRRAEYWIWVVKYSKAKPGEDPQDFMSDGADWEIYMYVEDTLAEKLFSIARRLPRVPTKKEVKDLLVKLDAGSDDWDDTQPDLLLAELLKVIV
jgi:hypothetical protein